MDQYLLITAEIRFLTEAEGGRRSSLDISRLGKAQYRPHLVVQDRDVRQAKLAADNHTVDEPYVAMTFVLGPPDYQNGAAGIFKFFCPYWMHPKHPRLEPGTEFTVREGARIVADGVVLERLEPEVV